MKQMIFSFFITHFDFYMQTLIVFLSSTILFFAYSIQYKYLLSKNSIFITFMLPIIVLFITKIISTNLYLSLGLIGALSIVRYRTPVKSIFELGYLFSLIGIGIIGGVSIPATLSFTFILSCFPIIYILINKYFLKSLNNDFRFYSNGSIEVNLEADLKYADKISDKYNKNIVRIEQNFELDKIFMLFNFDSMDEALNFKTSLKVLPNSLIINNN